MGKAVTLVNTPNKTSNFYPADDKRDLKKFPMKVSTVMVEWAAVCTEVSGSSPTGYLTNAATTNANGQNVIGILAEPIVATDSDYATAGKLKGVRVPRSPMAECFFTVWSWTFTAADVGRMCQIYSDSKSLAVDTNGVGAMITGYVSSTKGKCTFNVNQVVTS